MKKITSILTVLAMFIALNTSAKIWTVANFHNAANFTTLQAAIDGASSGDTLYIEGSTAGYGTGVFNKKLIVFGNGYWLDQNFPSQANKNVSYVGQLTFNAGSEGSEIQGIEIYGSISNYAVNYSLITINCGNITIVKNLIYLATAAIFNNYSGKAISIAANCNDIIIKQNWIETFTNSGGSNIAGPVYAISFAGIPTNSVISNNLIRAHKLASYGTPNSIAMSSNSPNGLLIMNNVIWGDMTTYYANHINNILVSGNFNGGGNSSAFNNLCSSTQYPTGNNNQRNVNMTNVFVNATKYIDNGYLLKAGSPAIGAGTNGVDCGAFGGDSYVLSGIAPIPSIYEVTIVPYVTTQLPVNIKAKSNR